MPKYPECETCARVDKRSCIGCQPMLLADRTFSRTGWIDKPETEVTMTAAPNQASAIRNCFRFASAEEAIRGWQE